MAVAQGSGTGGTTKKKPDDPYFDSESPAGSNFKQAKGTSSSTGFKDKQATADPYFSNTSPAGSTMSSDKSTWRSTNSGWNVPPSGGTAAQGGGTYNREAAAQSRSGSTVRDSNRDRGVTGDRASINTVISRDPGQEIAAPQFGKYDSPLVTLTNGSTVRQPNPNQNTWTPTLWGTDVNQKIQFSTPFTQQLGEAAQSAASAASNVWDRITGTGYPNMIADRQQRALDNNGPIIGELGATLVGIFGASEAAQKGVFSNYVPAAENARAVEDARGNVMIIGPNYARNTGVPVTEWEAQFGRDENGDLNTAPRTVAGEELDTTLSTGQAGSSVLGAWNKVFNFNNPNNVYVEKYGPDPNRTIFAPGAWDMFVQEIRNNVSGYDANNVYFNSLPPEDKRTVAQAYYDLQIHGPDAQLQGMQNLLTWDSQIENMRNAAELAYASNQPVIAAQMEAQANDMAKMSPTDIVEQQYNWGAEFAFAIGMPEPLDFVHLPVGAARIYGSRVLRDLGETISANAARKATEATVENANVAGKYAESMRLATEWLEKAAGRESEAFREWTGNADNIVGRMWSVTPETEITRIKNSFDDSYTAVLSHAGSQEEAKLLTRQFLQGKAFVENPEIGRNPFIDPELIRDMGLIAQYEEDILKLPSLNDGDFNLGRIQGEVSDFLQRQLVREFGLWPKDVPFGTAKIEAKPYVTKAGKTTSKFEVQFIGHDGKVISTRKGLFDTQAEAEKAAAAAKKAIDAEKPNWLNAFIGFQRTLLSTVFLYAPQFVIGNALAAAGTIMGDGVKSLHRSRTLLDKYAKMYGGAAPTGEILDVMKAEGMIEGTARVGQAAAGEAAQMSKDGGVRTVWGVIQDKMPEPLKWTMELQDRVAKFFGNAAFGTQIGAEEFWRLNHFNYAFDQVHTYGRDEAASVFAAGLQTLGVDAALANRLVDAFYQASSEESARTVLTKLRELTGQAEIRAGLASLNIGPTTVSAAGWSRMEDLIETVDPQNKEALGAAIGEWLQQEFRDINTMMAGSELPPLPFREVFTNMESAQQGAQITEDIIRIGQRAGMTQDEARKAATSLAQGVFDSEMGEFEAIRKALGIDPTNDQLQGALVFYQKVMSERRRVIDKVDKLYARLNKAETQADAQAIFDEVNKLWGDYSANLKVWGNDLRSSTFAQAAPQPPIVRYRQMAAQVEASLPPAQEGTTRLWRGNRPGELGQNPQFTNDLAGIALPFKEGYKGDLSYVDVPTVDLAKYEQTAGAAPGAEFILPTELASTAKKVDVPAIAPQQFVPAVGDTVRLTDGTEATVKQVLKENDLTSYVVAPRAQQAAQAAPQAAIKSADDVSYEDFVQRARSGFIHDAVDGSPEPKGKNPVDYGRDSGYTENDIIAFYISRESLLNNGPDMFTRDAGRTKHPLVFPQGTDAFDDDAIDDIISMAYDKWKKDFAKASLPQATQAAPTPTFVERTVNASEIVLPEGPSGARAVNPNEIASLYDNILDEYMTASGVEDDIAKIWSGQLAGQRSSDEWKTVKEASRKYLDSGRNNMLLSYGQYPSAEFFDEMLSAEMQINAASDHVVATLASRRDMALNKEISWNDYYKFRDETWRQWVEFAYAKYQYATVAGLRHTLGKGADDVLAKIPIQSIEPPFLSVDDVRRAQAIQEGKIPEGVRIPDKRIVASVKKHLGFDIAKLDDMTDEQLREAWRYYRKTATDNGINFEAQWFRYRMGEFAMFSGLADDMDAIETWWKVESAQYANGNAEIPNFGTARRQRVADAIDLARKVWDNIDEIAATTVPGVTPATRGEILKLINNTVASLDDIRYRAAKAGQEAAAYGMLNYWKRRGFDKKLGYLFGYSYYQTRAPLNWARRIAQNPAIAYDLYQYNRALKGENQQQFDQGAPGRIEGTLPNPMKALFQNLGKMEGMPGQQAAAAIGDWMPARFYEPSKFVIPYGWPNDFIDPSQANNGFERNMMRALRFTPVLLPMYTIPIGMALDIFAPKDNSYSRMADVQLGDYSKSLRMGAYALQSVPKQPESSWASALNPILGNKAPGFLGDQFDTGRINRAIFTGVAAGKYDPDIGRLAIAQMDNAQLGLENIPEMNDPKMAAAIQEVVNGAINDAGMERFANLIMGYTLRMPGQDTSAIEMEVRRANQERSSLGYGFDNQFGSQAAVTQFTDQAKLSSGVPLNDALAAMWNYSGTYDPAVDDKYGRVDVQVINDMAREERSAVYEEMGKATDQFIWEHPTASEGEVYEFQKPFWDQVDALKLKYPSATIFENADRYANRSPHHNPYERAQAELAAVIRYDPPGKPTYPEDGTPGEMDQYYTALGEWRLKDLSVIDRIGEQWVRGADTQPGKQTGDLQMARAVIGRNAQELVDTETLRFKSGIYIEWYMRENMAQAVRTANYADERERLTAEFGEDGYRLWQEYKAIPEDPSLEYPSWTPAHEAFVEENPEVQAMKIYDASPETYSYMLRNGGDHVFEALAMYPGGGTKSEKRQWESRWGREKKAVYWYFGVNDTLKSSRSKAREEGQAIGEDWRNNMNNPAYTQGFEPIGIDPNAGTVRSRSDYDALAQGNTDYTTLGGARAVQAAQQNVSMQQPQGSVMSRSDINRIIPDLTRPAPTPGVNAPPATTPADLQAYQEAKADGTLTEWIAKREAAIDAGEDTGGTRSSSGYGSGYRGYWYRGRYYRRRRSYRRSGGRRRYRSYSRGGRRGGYGGGYGGGGGGGYSTAEEQQPLYLRFDGPPQTYARDFATWLYPQSNNQTWRPTGINSGFTPPRGNVAIRPWRRINVRA